MNANTIMLLVLLAGSVQAQTIVCFESRIHAAPNSSYITVDTSNRNATNQPDYAPWMLGVPSISVVDVPTRLFFQVGTNGITNAVVQLNALLSNSVPATVRDRKNPRSKQEIGGWGTNIRSGNGLNDVKETLARMAEEIELLNERLERLEAR